MKIVIAEPIGINQLLFSDLQDQLSKKGHQIIAFETAPDSDDDLLKRIQEADIVVVSNLPISRKIIEQCAKLKLISVAFTGIDHIDTACCKKLGIQICNAAGYSTVAVSELTIGLIIDAIRKITELHKNTITSGTRNGFLGTELSDKTVGIVGTGSIGSKVAEILIAFGCKVIAYSRTKKESLEKLGVTYTELNQLLSESDIISLHIPFTSETNLMFNEECFARMKTGSYFINTARGKVIDSQALANALKSGKLSGAAVDIYEYEPPIKQEHPLISCPNIILTPHIAFATHEAIEKRSKIVIENIISWLEGKPKNICE
jgi:phosphoglycerate dehydrogenase-like enzyme